jgi:hypothetical protein
MSVMPTFPNEDIADVRGRLLAGIKEYKKAAGEDCGYTDDQIDDCLAIVDAYIAKMQKGSKLSQKDIEQAVKEALLDLNALNEKCDGSLIETDQREKLCMLILTAAKQAGLDADNDITERWRKW